MKRICVFETDGRWTFTPGAESRTWTTALDAANAAVVFGESLRRENAGYIIRLLLQSLSSEETDNFVLHTHVFVAATGPHADRVPRIRAARPIDKSA